MRTHLVLLGLLVHASCSAPRPPAPDQAALFEKNLDAIRRKDRAAYLACYRADEALVRNGPDGPKLGYAELAAHTSSTAAGWPQSLEASDLQLHWLGPGFVYGSYAYRVVFDGVASEGFSERVFARQPTGWQIVVTTAFGGPASSDPRLAEVAFLAGSWAETRDGRWTEESWTVARGGTMLGTSRTLVGGDTQAFEHLRIERAATGIELVARPSGQAEARFRLVDHGPGAATFENPAHDFPKRILYRREGGKLTARIEGDGQSAEWIYQRQ